MAESILLFGIAANVVQFVDFSSKVLSAGYKLYKDEYGLNGLEETRKLEVITKSLHRIIEGLESSLQQEDLKQKATQNELDLRELAKHCREIAEELLAAVGKLKVKGKPGKWNSFRAALKTLWDEDKIEAIQKRLDRFRQELVVHILVSLRDQINGSTTNQSSMLGRINSIDESTRGLGETFLDYVEDCRRWQADLIDAIHQDKSSAQERGSDSRTG